MLVYFDMDGVLTAFDEAYDRLVGQRQANGDVLWDKVAEHPFFFRDLKPMPRMQELWNLAPEGQRRILSAVPKSIEASDPQKRQWLQTHLGIVGDDVILVQGKEHTRDPRDARSHRPDAAILAQYAFEAELAEMLGVTVAELTRAA